MPLKMFVDLKGCSRCSSDALQGLLHAFKHVPVERLPLKGCCLGKVVAFERLLP
jgi:hypothetical protein